MLLTPSERAVMVKNAVLNSDFQKVKDLMFDSDIPDAVYADKTVKLISSSLFTIDDLLQLADNTTWTMTMRKVAEIVNKETNEDTIKQAEKENLIIIS